ncbi:hypothetical protein [Streptomyces sp. NPDC005953]|uniref:hypothetical protein n=1 Tax=Streptomyces sp. NPDC005953 TaxID=3156719 RepID=UPI0033E523D1
MRRAPSASSGVSVGGDLVSGEHIGLVQLISNDGTGTLQLRDDRYHYPAAGRACRGLRSHPTTHQHTDR